VAAVEILEDAVLVGEHWHSGSYFDFDFVGFALGGPAFGGVGIGASRLLAAAPGVLALESVSGALEPPADFLTL
jgi:hypothetical protein